MEYAIIFLPLIGSIFGYLCKSFNKFLEVLNKPYLEQRDIINYQMPIYSNEKYQTFCGT